jgi:hypothetical protein
MENVGTGIVVTSYYTMGGEGATAEEAVSRRTPVFRNIAISSVTINHAAKAIDIEGLPEMPIKGLRLTDVVASGKTGLLATDTDGLELHHVQVNADGGAAFAIDHAANLLLDDVTTSKPIAASPVVRLTHSPGAILRASRASPGTGVFLSVGPGELRSVAQSGNELQNARSPTEER